MVAPAEFLKYIDNNKDGFINRLKTAVSHKSVSADPSLRDAVKKMGQWLNSELIKYGVETKIVPLEPPQKIEDPTTGEEVTLDLPPAIVGRIGNDPTKKTILVYGHYDVQPAQKSDGWNTEPFELYVDEGNDKLIGRGSTDDKGPIMGWLNVLEAHHSLGLTLPVNLRFCFEGMEESGSKGLDDFIRKEVADPEGWFQGVDAGCISDNYWLNNRTPCLTYGLRGIASFSIKVTGPGHDLHSGMYGGAVYEPMTCLIALLNTLVTQDGQIKITDANAGVTEATAEEKAKYAALDYTVQDLEDSAGGKIALSDDKVTVLMGRSRYPSLSIHGIEGAYSGEDVKTVIPATVRGKFSIRLVPPQNPEDVTNKVKLYLEQEFAKLNTKCNMTVEAKDSGAPWVADYNHWNYKAAEAATQAIYLQNPDFTREGGSIPVTLTFADALGVNILLLPMGRGDDGAHSTNEKMNISNYLNGTKLLGTYLYEVPSFAK